MKPLNHKCSPEECGHDGETCPCREPVSTVPQELKDMTEELGIETAQSRPCGEASAGAEVFAGRSAELSGASDFYNDDTDYDADEEDDGFECGAFINGKFDYYHCQLAGTEDCDWECPYSASMRGLRE